MPRLQSQVWTNSSVTLSLLLIVSLVLVLPIASASGLRVGAFNIQRFGVKAISDPIRSSRIVDILKAFDVALIVEVVDVTEQTIPELTKKLEEETGSKWLYATSERLGRSKNYMEQYAFVYRDSAVTAIERYQDRDPTFIRPPFAVLFETRQCCNRYPNKFVLMGIHTQPTAAFEELGKLGQAMKNISINLNPEVFSGVIAMGDFNADCSYVTDTQEAQLDIFKGEEFDSLIPDEWDTTVAQSHCAYDRLVTYPKGKVKIRDVKVTSLESKLLISNEEAKQVSDHYPIEFILETE